jgi:hypothetical protein
MPPISPCGLVVDFVRSCFKGRWRLFPSRPDILTPGFHFFADEETAAVRGPHAFGSGVWNKDGMIYPPTAVGEYMRDGHQWYDGHSPVVVAPDRQIFDTTAFAADLPFPPDPPVDVFNGFDSRCWVEFPPGFDLDLDRFFRPDINNCCWQRVLGRFLALLSDDTPGALALVTTAAGMLWGDATNIVITPLDTTRDRLLWVNTPAFQVVLCVGTQTWEETWQQAWHGLQAPTNFGRWSTSVTWLQASDRLARDLQRLGFNPDKPLTLVGHSRGAAKVWIFARRMTDFTFNRNVDVLTFESPKVGDFRMIQNANLTNTRHIINAEDIIPLVPPNIQLLAELRALLPGVDLDPMTLWKNYSVYQIIGRGQAPRIAPASELPALEAAAFIRLVITGRVPNPVVQHFMQSQVDALAACCDAPIFPFTDAFWALLFGVIPPPAPGGLMIGQIGTIGKQGEGGLKLGGKGILVTLAADMLLEDGTNMLIEDGTDMLLEVDIVDSMLLEDATPMLLEDATDMLLE